jgi:hypothetical protein
MTIVKKAVFASTLAGALAGSLYEANDAAAFGIRRAAPECYVLAPTVGGTIASGIITNNTDDSIFAYCPTPEDASVSASSIKTINVHGHNASPIDMSYAQVCWNNWYDDGGGCRNLVKTPDGDAQFTMQLGAPNFSSTYVAGDEANFKYIMVRLGRRKTSSFYSPSSFRGIFFAN